MDGEMKSMKCSNGLMLFESTRQLCVYPGK